MKKIKKSRYPSVATIIMVVTALCVSPVGLMAEPIHVHTRTVRAMQQGETEPLTFLYGIASSFRFELTKPKDVAISFTLLPAKNWENILSSQNVNCEQENVLNVFTRMALTHESADEIFGVRVEGSISNCGGGGGGGGKQDQFAYELDSEREIKIVPDEYYAQVNEEVPLKAVHADGSDSVVLATWAHNGGGNAEINPGANPSSTATFSATKANTYEIKANSLYGTHTAQAEIHVVEVVIKDQNGEHYPTPYIGVNQTVQFKAVVDPDLSAYGTFAWTKSSGLIEDLQNSTSQTVTVVAKENPSSTIDDKVELKVIFTHTESGKKYVATHEILVVRVDLEAIKTVENSLLENGLICLNAQEEYKNAKWKAIIKPAGLYGEVTSSEKVSILNIEQEPLVVGDGDPFDIKGNSIGTYELTIQLQEEPLIDAEKESVVFKFVILKDDNAITANPYRLAPPMGEFYTNYISDFGPGNVGTIQYMLDVKVKSEPEVPSINNAANFRVRGNMKNTVLAGQFSQFRGRSNSEEQTFAEHLNALFQSDEIQLLIGLGSTQIGDFSSSITNVALFWLNKVAGNQNKRRYHAIGVSKTMVEVEGSFVHGVNNITTNRASSHIMDDVVMYSVYNQTYATSPPPPFDHGATITHSAEVKQSEVITQQRFIFDQYTAVKVGVQFSWDTKKELGWQYEGRTFWSNDVYHFGGIDLHKSEIAMNHWNIDIDGSFEILPTF